MDAGALPGGVRSRAAGRDGRPARGCRRHGAAGRPYIDGRASSGRSRWRPARTSPASIGAFGTTSSNAISLGVAVRERHPHGVEQQRRLIDPQLQPRQPLANLLPLRHHRHVVGARAIAACRDPRCRTGARSSSGGAVDEILLDAPLRGADVGHLLDAAGQATTSSCWSPSIRTTRAPARCSAAPRATAARPRRVPRATSGRVSSDEVVVSVKRAVSVFIAALACCPRAIQLVERRRSTRRRWSAARQRPRRRRRQPSATITAIARIAVRRVGTLIVAMVTYAPCSARSRVSGIGVVSAFGTSHAAFRDALLEGRSGIAPVSGFDTSGCRSTLAARDRRLRADGVGLADEAAADGSHRRLRGRGDAAGAARTRGRVDRADGDDRSRRRARHLDAPAGSRRSSTSTRSFAAVRPARRRCSSTARSANSAASLAGLEFKLRGPERDRQPQGSVGPRRDRRARSICCATGARSALIAGGVDADLRDVLQGARSLRGDVARAGVLQPRRAVRRGARRIRPRRRRLRPVAGARRRRSRRGTHGEILGVGAVERRGRRSTRGPTGRSRWCGRCAWRSRMPGLTPDDVDVVYASANATPALDAVEADGADRRSSAASRPSSRRSRARSANSARRARAACAAALLCGARGPRAADRRPRRRRIRGSRTAAPRARTRSTRPGRSCWSTASPAAARSSASCLRVAERTVLRREPNRASDPWYMIVGRLDHHRKHRSNRQRHDVAA